MNDANFPLFAPKPEYKGGEVNRAPQRMMCYCKKNIGAPVWEWWPSIKGHEMDSMYAHEECFDRLWAGEN